MSVVSASAAEGGGALHSPASVFASVLSAAVGVAVARLEQKLTEWTDKISGGEGGSSQGLAARAEQALDDGDGGESSGLLTAVADAGLDQFGEGGLAQKAGAEGAKALLHGENPIWAAAKGVWHSGPPVLKAAIVTAGVGAVLLLLLSPVLLLVFLLALLIFAAIQQARPAISKTREKLSDHLGREEVGGAQA